MLYRVGLILLGLFFVACCAGGFYVAVSSRERIVAVVEGVRASLFGLIGVFFLMKAVRADASNARSLLRDYLSDVFSRRNLTEFAALMAIAFAAAAVMLLIRG